MKPWLKITAISALALIAGCAGHNVNFDTWRSSVDRYVRDHGGDPAVLRDMELPDGRRGFAMIGADEPAQATDASGLLIGPARSGEGIWLVYLVGVVDRLNLREIRAAAMRIDAGEPQWKKSSDERGATQRYIAHARSVQSPPANLTFPAVNDRFKLDVTPDGAATVTHAASGASWKIDLR